MYQILTNKYVQISKLMCIESGKKLTGHQKLKFVEKFHFKKI